MAARPTTNSLPGVYDTLTLQIYNDAFVLEPRIGNSNGINLIVERTTGNVRLNDTPFVASSTLEESLQIHGILGFVRLNSGEHMIVITERQKIGKLNLLDSQGWSGHDVYKMSSYRLLPVSPVGGNISQIQVSDDVQYLSMVEDILGIDGFYFSPTYDLTQSFQRQNLLFSASKKPMWDRASDHFYFNKHMQQKLTDLAAPYINTSLQPPLGMSAGEYLDQLSKFILPTIFGFVSIHQTSSHNTPFTLTLISRRSRYRAGTRYHARGIDEEGHVANFVETEQLITFDPLESSTGYMSEVGQYGVFSHVQIRGSVPVHWAQNVNLKYTPQLVVENRADTIEHAKLHFNQLTSMYGDVYAVNLVNKKGYEYRVGEAFSRLMTTLQNEATKNKLDYTWWDFHTMCKGLRFDRVSLLVQDMLPQLTSHSYFHMDGKGVVKSLQKGVVRTNCMDCLDRTGVLQSEVAKWVLTQQLVELNIMAQGEPLLDSSPQASPDKQAFTSLFKNTWADTADLISLQYSGTPALKTDYTRTGKRTRIGAVVDGINSAMRYVRGNFIDGGRQDAWDLVTGVVNVDPSKEVDSSPFWDLRPPRIRYEPYVLLFGLLMTLGTLLLTPLTLFSTSSQSLSTLAFFGIITAAVGWDMMRNGRKFVDLPRLRSFKMGARGYEMKQLSNYRPEAEKEA